MKFEAKDGEATIWIYDAIGEMFGPDAVTAKGVRDRLAAFRGIDKLTIRINSPGGVVDDATAIHTLLAEYPAEKLVKVDGIAASAASLIAMSGKRIQMAKGSQMMIHHPWGLAVGNYRQLARASETAKSYSEALTSIYSARTGKTRDEIWNVLEASDEGTYFTADKAVEMGLADDIGDAEPIAACVRDDIMDRALLVAQLAFAKMVSQSAESFNQTIDAMNGVAQRIAVRQRELALAKMR